MGALKSGLSGAQLPGLWIECTGFIRPRAIQLSLCVIVTSIAKNNMKSSNRFWIVASVVYFLIILSIMLLADMGKFVNFSLAQPPYDKVGHFVLYGIASFLCHRATGKKMMSVFNYPIPFGPALFTIFTAGEELLQAILPNRTASIEDFFASFAGILVFYWIGEVWDRKKGKRSRSQ